MKWQGRGPQRRRAHRLRRWALGGLAGLLVALLVTVGGIAWYFSGVAVAVDHSPDLRANTASLVSPQRVRISKDAYSLLPGRYGLLWDGGSATVGAIVSVDASSVTRDFEPGSGTLAPGTPVSLDPFAYTGDPRSALGLPFQEVQVSGPLGRYPAWYVPPPGSARSPSSTWVVFVHGHDSQRAESLRYLSRWSALGLPVLVPTYRNDVGAPPSPDGTDHLGDTEWSDVEPAVQWAVDHGAHDVVLAGWSMGGAVSLQLVDRSPLRDRVRGLILDSPVIDWRDVLAHQGADRGLPAPVTDLAIWTTQQRSHLDLDRFDWVSRNRVLSKPMLVFASDGDTYVPDGPTKQLAAARPDLVQLVSRPLADHTRMWNVDPGAYEDRMAAWLTGVGAAG